MMELKTQQMCYNKDDKTQNKQNVFKYSNETPRSPTNLC